MTLVRPYPTTRPINVDDSLGAISLFTVRPNIPLPDALLQACEFMRCASASAYELTDNAPPAFRPLAGSIVHLIESARALVEASVVGLEQEYKV